MRAVCKKKWQNMTHSELYIALVSYEILDYCLNGIVLKKSFQNNGMLFLAEFDHFQHFWTFKNYGLVIVISVERYCFYLSIGIVFVATCLVRNCLQKVGRLLMGQDYWTISSAFHVVIHVLTSNSLSKILCRYATRTVKGHCNS